METNMLEPVYIFEQFKLYFLKLLVLIEGRCCILPLTSSARGVFSRELVWYFYHWNFFCNRPSSLLRFGRLQLYFGSSFFFFMFVPCPGIYCTRMRLDLNTTAFIYVDSMLAVITAIDTNILKLKSSKPSRLYYIHLQMSLLQAFFGRCSTSLPGNLRYRKRCLAKLVLAHILCIRISGR